MADTYESYRFPSKFSIERVTEEFCVNRRDKLVIFIVTRDEGTHVRDSLSVRPSVYDKHVKYRFYPSISP